MRSKELWVVMIPSHRVPSVGKLAAARGEIFLGGNQQLRIGVQLHALTRELRQHMIGDDIEGLVISPACFIFMPAATMTLRPCPAWRDIATARDAPDGVFLMRVEGDMRGHARKGWCEPSKRRSRIS